MRYKPSTFYSNFSLADLVKRNNSRLGVDCSSEGIGGGGGGGMGGDSRFSGSKEARYHKTESFSCYLKSTGRGKPEESNLLSSLKADIQDEIINARTRITGGGDLNVSSFYFEYREEGIQGRIEISGKVTGASYYNVTAALSETSTNENQPLIVKESKGHQPLGTYYVVPFMPDDLRANAQELHELGRRALKESTKRIRQRLFADCSSKESLLENLEYAEVYVWTPMSSEIKQKWKEAMGEEFEVPAEYDRYGKVYFLNEVALKMYREAGEDIEVLKTISADEMRKIPGPSLRGPYMTEGAY